MAQELVVRHEKSIDLLLGLIAYLAWYHNQKLPDNKPSIAVILQLAHSLVYDMGLNKPAANNVQKWLCVESIKQPEPKPRDMEERRAVLAFFFISST